MIIILYIILLLLLAIHVKYLENNKNDHLPLNSEPENLAEWPGETNSLKLRQFLFYKMIFF